MPTKRSTAPAGGDGRAVAPPRPAALIPEPDGIPAALRERARWVAWRYELVNGRWTKVPYRADGDGKASTVNSDTWSTFEAAWAAYETGEYDGIGFVVGDGITAGDIDHCRAPDGELTADAQDALGIVKTYTEWSPSNEGARFLAYGALPAKGRKRGAFEMYDGDGGRYVTITGHHVDGTPKTIERREPELAVMHARFIARPERAKARRNGTPANGQGQRLSDAEVIEVMKRGPKGADLARLYDGDMSAYEDDHSAADMALAGALVRACNGDTDAAQVDRLFRDSKLMRDKWDEQRGAQTYGERTIGRALDDFVPADLGPSPRDESDPGPGDADAPSDAAVATSDESAANWPDPEPLPPAADEPGPIDPELLPEPLRDWLIDAAERASLPLEFFVPATLVTLSGLIGNRVRVQPKRYDDFIVVPNLWGALVAHTGTMKSHATSTAAAPIKRLESELRDDYEAKRQRLAGRREDLELERTAIEERRKQAAKGKNGIDRDSLAGLRAELDDVQRELDETELPEPAVLVNDSTVEKMVELLRDNPRGLILMRDELLGWLRSLEKQGRESDRTFYLEAWNGDQPFTQHRIGRGTTSAAIVTLSIYGAIQPGAFRKYQDEAMAHGEGADGLLQRFQILIWPDENMQPYQHVDRAPDTAAQTRVMNLCRELYHLDVGAINGSAPPEPFGGFGGAMAGIEYAVLRFDEGAQKLHDDWRTELENRLRSPLSRARRAYLSQVSKYRSLFPSLAGLYHLIEVISERTNCQNRQKQERARARIEPNPTPQAQRTDVTAKSPDRISLETARRAAAMVEYLDAHARKVYAAEVNAERLAAHLILEHVAQGHVQDGDKVRDLIRKDWSGLDRANMELGLDHLDALGWLRVERVPTGGRPSRVVRLHPSIHDHLGGRL